MLKEDQHVNLTLNTNGTKSTMKVVKPMLGLYLVFLTEFVQMNFAGLKIANAQWKHGINFKLLMKICLLQRFINFLIFGCSIKNIKENQI